MTLRWPRLRLRPALALLLLAAVVGTAQGLLLRSLQLSRGADPQPWLLLFQLTGAFAAWAAMPVAQFSTLNAPVPSRASGVRASLSGWARFLIVHLLGYLSFSAVHIALIRTLRWLLLRLSLVSSADGPLKARVLWEMQNDIVVYACAAAILTILNAWRERDETALRSAALEARLAEARLDALAAQVDPHFFYNALNTISATMYEDLPRTERYLSHLATIMRATLRRGERTWTLDEERAHTERYLDLLIARFGSHLCANWRQAADVGHVLLRRFAVQSLVENAVKHNARRREPLTIEIDIQRSGDALSVVVADNGLGFSTPAADSGRGIGRLEETLRLLHGPAGRLSCGANSGGGARVQLRVPCASR